MVFKNASSGHTNPSPSDLRRLLDAYHPATVLVELEGEITPELKILRAEALLELDQAGEALACLDPLTSILEGDYLSEAERLRSIILLRAGWVDAAILSAMRAEEAAQDSELKAVAFAWEAVGFTSKGCLKMADDRLREALLKAPNAPRVLAAQARMCLEGDMPIQAREIYERLIEHHATWAKVHGMWGCSYIAYLLGEFDQAEKLAEEAVTVSEEIISPLFVAGQVALARDDLSKLEDVVQVLEQRSPKSESLSYWREGLESMRLRKTSGATHTRKRLEAFPTLVQRRDHCGPATMELVMRYWKGAAEYSNDQIAEKVKIAHSGTPVYRMKEFFHLAGFDTVRAMVPVEKLKTLIDAGFPVIVQEEFSNSAHVAVVIGYDEEAGCIELQDPMTHIITRTPIDEFNRLRQTYLDAALIAFPHGRGLEKRLTRLGIYNNAALVWCDQAVLEIEQNRFEQAVFLAQKAVKKEPALKLGWMLLCHAKLERWKLAQDQSDHYSDRSVGNSRTVIGDEFREMREDFYRSLGEAKFYFPEDDFIFQYIGSGALVEHDFLKGIVAFKSAVEIDTEDSRTYASLAECYYAVRDFELAYEAASHALQHGPNLAAANAWTARSLAALNRGKAEHYARMAVDLSPDWWVSHLALAEAFFQQNKLLEAWREVELALSLSSGNLEVRVTRGVLLELMGERKEAMEELQSILASQAFLSPASIYNIYQALGKNSFRAEMFEQAAHYARQILELMPDDPWGVQFWAAVHGEMMRNHLVKTDDSDINTFLREYEHAVRVNQGDIGVVSSYLGYLKPLAGLPTCLVAIEELQQAYPEKGGLTYLEGRLRDEAGEKEAATQCMLKALSRSDGVSNRDELLEAVRVILKTKSVDFVEQVILENPIPEGGASLKERQRALGLALASSPGKEDEKARELLLVSLETDPEDALVMLRLGDVSQYEQDRESCYRRALGFAPGWAHARANLANYLIERGRETEAWEFTSGHTLESQEILSAHGRALLGMGHYEEAVTAIEQALQQSEVVDEALFESLWLAQLRNGSYESALKTARKCLKRFKGDKRWYVRVATSFQELGYLDEAYSILERGTRNGLGYKERLKAEYELAFIQHEYGSALQILEELLESVDEKSEDGRLGWVASQKLRLLMTMGDFDGARRMVLQENLTADGWGYAASIISNYNDNELTLELADRALAMDPVNHQGLLARAVVLNRLDRDEEARIVLRNVLDIFPGEHKTYEMLALQVTTDGELERAFALSDRAVELGHFCPYAWATRGLIHFLRGNLEEAKVDLQSGWNRADSQQREKGAPYWWILALLQGEDYLAEERRQKAYREAITHLELRLISMIEQVLAY